MTIPIFGLIDTGTIKTKTKVSDGYGGITISEETTLITSWKYRKTVPKTSGIEELFMTASGKSTSDKWYFTGEYYSTIKAGQYIIEADSSKFEIMDVEVKRDALGNNHHLLITAEKI